MKHVIYGLMMFALTAFFILAVITIESRTNRENNQQRALKKAVDNAIESVLENQTFSVYNDEQFVASISAMICDSLISKDRTKTDSTTPDTNLKLTLEIVDADYERGLICMNTILEYTNPFGSIGTCEYSTTVVFDEAKVHDEYRINYYDYNGILIETYMIRAGDVWPEPSDSLKNRYRIGGWYTNLGGSGNEFVITRNCTCAQGDGPHIAAIPNTT